MNNEINIQEQILIKIKNEVKTIKIILLLPLIANIVIIGIIIAFIIKYKLDYTDNTYNQKTQYNYNILNKSFNNNNE